MKKPTKHNKANIIYTLFIPYTNILSFPKIYSDTLYPALMLINAYKIDVANVIPAICPKFLVNEFILPAIPNLSRSQLDITSALLAG